MARRGADFEASSSDEDEAVVFDRETYLKKLQAYKIKARKDIRKMCHLEFQKTCDDLLATAHHIMQDYVQFGEELAATFEKLSVKDREDDGHQNDNKEIGLQDVVEDIHSKFQSDFVKLMEPLKDVKKMGIEYRGM